MSTNAGTFLRAITLVAIAAGAGTTLSVALAESFGIGRIPFQTFAIAVAVFHFILIGVFALVSENLIEDAVKAGIIIALSLALGFATGDPKMPGVSFAGSSASILGVAVNAYVKRLIESRRK